MSWTWDNEHIETLISLVFERPVLWDGTHPQGKNSYFLGKQWQDVALRMGFPETKEGKDKVRNKWRSLLAKYALGKSKVECLRSGAGADEIVHSSWPHYSSLQFISDSLSKKSNGNIDFLNTKAASKSSTTNTSTSTGGTSQASTSQASTSQASTSQASDTASAVITDEQSLIVQSNSTDKVVKSSIPIESLTFEEADWNNFMSLMPYLNEINNIQDKLKFRMEVMYYLLKFIDQQKKSLEVNVANEKEVKKEMEEGKTEMQELKKRQKMKKEMEEGKTEMQELKKRQKIKKEMQEVKEMQEEVYISDDEDCVVLDVDLTSRNKKIKVEPTSEIPVVKKEIEVSQDFKDYVKNHFCNIKKE